ncbi:MAG TPA: mechanosensitive ion channel [Bacteroidales bacterium]|nr:mechanosensitive ion channel [Bacteroidales bacterium]HPR58232.1 mechanosensitive ion channel [Bacteroidales bacterium]HRW97783.1 mechanosensitive ion channel [Bacteroidales bacterium]
MNSFERVLQWLQNIWNTEILKLGETSLTFRSFVIFIVSIILLFYLTAKLKKLLALKILPRYKIDTGVSQSIATIVRYTLLILGLYIILQTSGIDLSALGVLVGALGVGIGFGLQNITNNFISGIIILFERPIKVGDRVELDEIAGTVSIISARATTVITNDNISVIVPNSDFINQRVINWSLNDRTVRFNFPVGVSYKEDPARIKKLLLEVADSNPGVLKDPKPDVLFDEFAESSLNFNLRVWSYEYSSKPQVLKSQLYYAIFEKFKEHNIEIPYPQRDIHIIKS